MQKTIKKAIAALSATACLIPSAINVINTNATTANVLLGDANGNGYVTISDAVFVYQYLTGAYTTDEEENITAMDINQDYVIDWADYDAIIALDSTGGTPSTVLKELYEVPNNEPRSYIKYNYPTGVRTPYSLSEVPDINPTNADLLESLYEPVRANDNYFQLDSENKGVVLIKSNGNVIGSGFLVSEHIVATSAITVYTFGNDTFKTNVTIDIFGNTSSTGGNPVTVTPTYVHIPTEYMSPTDYDRHNYNYALLYFPNNLTLHSGYSSLKQEYGFFDFGCAVTAFDQSAELVTTSGYRFENSILARYFDSGAVINFGASDGSNLRKYRLKSLGHCDQNQFGGVMYYQNSANACKNAVAIATGFGLHKASWGTRITPTLIKFYLQNSYI